MTRQLFDLAFLTAAPFWAMMILVHAGIGRARSSRHH
jgi:hypothetical protein